MKRRNFIAASMREINPREIARVGIATYLENVSMVAIWLYFTAVSACGVAMAAALICCSYMFGYWAGFAMVLAGCVLAVVAVVCCRENYRTTRRWLNAGKWGNL